jgi:Right handed beta helix region
VRKRYLFPLLALALVAAAAGALVGRGDAEPACDRYASTAGSDRATGTRDAPFRSVQRLVDSVGGGGRACLLAGRYRGDVRFERGGTEARRLVLAAEGRAVVNGIVTVADSADHVTIEGLVIDGADPPTADGVLVKIFGDHVHLRANDISAAGERGCIQTGDANGSFGVAWHPVIERNRIHDCGNRGATDAEYRAYPSGHALYLQADRHALVRDNYIYDTNFGGDLGGRGIQLWPDSQHAVVEHNVVDNSNEWNVIISGADYETGTTRGAKVRNNVLTNPVEHNVTSAWWGVEPTGGNEVVGNCVFGASGEELAFTTWLGGHSYDERDNLRADPLYVDRAAKDFRLREGSPCEGKGPRAE